MVVDELKFEDLDALKNIYDDAFSKSSDIEIMKNKFLEISNLKNTKMLCIREDNKLVGFLKCDIIEDFVSVGKSYMFLSNLCVLKECRGKGYSKILMTEAEKKAINSNCEYIFLTCSNEKMCAHGIYQKLGYNIKSTNVFIKYL